MAGSPTDAATAALCYTSLAASASTTSNCPTAASAAAAASNAASIAADRAGSEHRSLPKLSSGLHAGLPRGNRLIIGSRAALLLLELQHDKSKVRTPSNFRLQGWSGPIGCFAPTIETAKFVHPFASRASKGLARGKSVADRRFFVFLRCEYHF